jgi:hypothetical protein
MAATVESVEIARRPEEIFDYLLDPLNFPEWDDSVVSARREDPAPLAVGSRTAVFHRMGPLRMRTTEELIELNPPRRFTNRGVTGGLAGIATVTVEPLDAGRRSHVTISLEIQGRGLAKLMLPLARPQSRKVLPRNLMNLKVVLEAGATDDHRQRRSTQT